MLPVHWFIFAVTGIFVVGVLVASPWIVRGVAYAMGFIGGIVIFIATLVLMALSHVLVGSGYRVGRVALRLSRHLELS